MVVENDLALRNVNNKIQAAVESNCLDTERIYAVNFRDGLVALLTV